MIEVSRRIPVNEPGQPVLTRSDVWRGLVMKADNALPFVPAMTHCQVLHRESDTVFVREIEFRGERCRERITLMPQERVRFDRLDGSVLGTINNLIEEDADGLGLRFAFSLKLAGVEDGSPEEVEYGKIVEKDYLRAVDATLAAIRKMKAARDTLIQRYFDAVDAMDMETFKSMHSQQRPRDLRQFPAGRRAGADRRRDRPLLVDHRRVEAQRRQPLGQSERVDPRSGGRLPPQGRQAGSAAMRLDPEAGRR